MASNNAVFGGEIVASRKPAPAARPALKGLENALDFAKPAA